MVVVNAYVNSNRREYPRPKGRGFKSRMTSAPKVIRNPATSVISRELPYNIGKFHVTRAAQVLQIQQGAGRFGKDFDTFYGTGVAASFNEKSTAPDRAPQGTKRRNLASLASEGFLRGNYKFPSRIHFTQATGESMLEALLWILTTFNRRASATRSVGKAAQWKGHRYHYSESLRTYINGKYYEGVGPTRAAIQNADRATYVEMINIAPHASALEIEEVDGVRARSGRFDTLFPIAREANARFAPAVQVGFDYVGSDYLGLTYGKGTGGPARGGQVYALPRIIVAVDAEGLSNANFRRPGTVRPRSKRRR